MLKKLAILFLSVAACLWNLELCFPYISQETATSEFASFIPKKDLKRLEYFFRRLIFWEDGAYVLVGSKPCAISVFQKPTCLNFLTPSNIRFWVGWKTWKKYERYFPHPAYSILEEKKDNGASLLVFLKNAEFIDVLFAHKSEFEEILQRPIEPSQILMETQSAPLFSQILKNHDFLIGLILGFGRHNSWMFYSNCGNEKIPMRSFTEEDQRFSNWIRSCGILGFVSGSLFSDITQIHLPGFVSDPDDSETIQLKKKYSIARQKIIQYYDQKNFFDATMALLMAEKSLAP